MNKDIEYVWDEELMDLVLLRNNLTSDTTI